MIREYTGVMQGGKGVAEERTEVKGEGPVCGKEKVEAGVTSLVSQMFFDNAFFYRFLDKVRAMGIDIPIHAGIMPITTAKQLGTTVSLSGSSVPKALADTIIRKVGADEIYAFPPQAQVDGKAGLMFAVAR